MTVPRPLASPLLQALPGVRHGFFTREGGVSRGLYAGLNAGPGSADDPLAVAENRRRVAAAFAADAEQLFTCDQIHSATVVVADGPHHGPRPRADGVITARPGLVCAALSADCAPVLLADPRARVVGAAHAGWRGALEGVIESAVRAMADLGARRDRIVAAVGPCIGPRSYEVGEEFRERFVADSAESDRYFAPGARPEKRLFDLPGFVLWRLKQGGVDRAEWTGHDTFADESAFFSNRRAVTRGEPDYGRLISAIALAPGLNP